RGPVAAVDGHDVDDGGFAAGGQDRVGVVGGVAPGPVAIRRGCEHRVVEVVGEVQLAGQGRVADVDHDVDVHGAARIPAGIDGVELDHACAVRRLAAAQEGLVRQVLAPRRAGGGDDRCVVR